MPPLHERKAPPQKRKAPLLTTFWRRFWSYKIAICINETMFAIIFCFNLVESDTLVKPSK